MRKLLAKEKYERIEKLKHDDFKANNLKSKLTIDELVQGIDYYSINDIPE